jgi:hypothetical protein
VLQIKTSKKNRRVEDSGVNPQLAIQNRGPPIPRFRSFLPLYWFLAAMSFCDEFLFSIEESGHFLDAQRFSHSASPLDLPAPVYPLLCSGPGSRQASSAASRANDVPQHFLHQAGSV